MLQKLVARLLICSLVLAAVAMESQARNPYEDATENGLAEGYGLALVGDSITLGTTADPEIPGEHSGNCWEDTCFASRLQFALDQAFVADKAPAINVIKVGVGGATSRDYDPNDFSEDDAHFTANLLLTSSEGRPLFHNIPASRVAVVYLGTNDAIGFFEPAGVVSVEEYEAHMFDIMRTLRRNGVKVVVLVTPPVPRVWQETVEGDLMRGYREAIRRACKRSPRHFDSCFLDLQDEYPEDEWLGDALHPTIAGHGFISSRISAHLMKFLGHPRHRGERD